MPPTSMDAGKVTPITEGTMERLQPLTHEVSKEPNEEVQQDGVQIAEAVTTTWTRKHLIVAYTR